MTWWDGYPVCDECAHILMGEADADRCSLCGAYGRTYRRAARPTVVHPPGHVRACTCGALAGERPDHAETCPKWIEGPTRCGRCDEPARGYASINGVRFCHEGPSPTCYELAQREPTPCGS